MKRQKLSLHINRGTSADPAEAAKIIPPLVEVIDAWAGLCELKVRTTKGVRLARLEVLKSAIDDELLLALADWQARHSHPFPELVS